MIEQHFDWPEEPRSDFNGEMLRLARGARGMTQDQLGAKLKVSQGKIAKWESAFLSPGDDEVPEIAAALNFTSEFFFQRDAIEGFGSCCIYHRKRQTLPAHTLNRIHDCINVLSMGIARLLKNVTAEPRHEMVRLDIDEYRTPEAAARALRAAWKMPLGPVRNLSLAIESAGGIVVPCPFGTDKLDAVSLWPEGMPPLFFINRESPADRCRFTLCHELGHIVMHRVPPPGKSAESQADRFASEFLMPSRDIAPDLDAMTLDKAQRLKSKWRVSMAALIEKSHTLEKITSRRRRTLYTEMSRNGHRTKEPGRFEPERPKGLLHLVNVHRSQLSCSDADLAKATFCTSAESFRGRFGLEWLGDTSLRIVRDDDSTGKADGSKTAGSESTAASRASSRRTQRS